MGKNLPNNWNLGKCGVQRGNKPKHVQSSCNYTTSASSVEQLWQFISQCLIIFIVQLNKELIKRRVGCPGWDQLSLSSQMLIVGLGSTDLPTDPRSAGGPCEGAQPRGGCKAICLPASLHLDKHLMPLVRETAFFSSNDCFFREALQLWSLAVTTTCKQECSEKSI